MRLDELSLGFLRLQVDRLYAASRYKPQTEKATLVAELQRMTAGWSESEVVGAISGALDDCAHFPGTHDIKKRRPARPFKAVDWSNPDLCQQCRAHFYYAGFETHEGIVCPRLRCDCPQFDTAYQRGLVNQDGIAVGWHTPDAKAWVETDAKMIADGYAKQHREDWAA